MAEKIHRYQGEAIAVTFNSKRCIHAAECVKGLPAVFDPQRKPWVLPDAGSVDQLAAVIERCPTGALAFERKDGGKAETPAAENAVTIAEDGPLFARGDVEVLDGDKVVISREMRVALCRCGASKNKPFCDGAHAEAEFRASAAIPNPKILQKDVETTQLRVTAASNGPLILEGPMTIESVAGPSADSCQGTRAALCRCGSSNNKPFCDGAHAQIGFQAD